MSLTIEHWAEQLDNAGHGEKGRILKQACETLGLSKDALYRRLKQLGWTSGKCKRSDAGKTTMSEATIDTAIALLNLGMRDNGKRIMDVTLARSILVANGFDCVSHSQLCRILAKRNASVNDLDRATPHMNLRSLGPNHVHQTDPSYCLLYYPPGRKGKIQRYANDAEFYANKPENLEKIKHIKVWRYVLVDHATGYLRFKYYEAAGENQGNLFDFLMWCWRKQDNLPFHGVPEILLWDKGSANTSAAIKNVLKALDVKNIPHEAGNPRAKGAVEKANDMVEKQFETRLLIEPVDSVDALNEAAMAWQDAFNANKIPGMSTLHSRTKQSRLDAWKTIYSAEHRHRLRELPDEHICRTLLTKDGETRKVRGDLTITFVHPVAGKSLTYDLAELEHIKNGMHVEANPLVVNDSLALLVGVTNPDDEVIYHQVEPLELDEFGFRADAPVIGDDINSHKDTATQTAVKAADQLAYPDMNAEQIKKAKKQKSAPFKGELVGHSNFKDIEHETHISPKADVIKPDSAVVAQLNKQADKPSGKKLDGLDARILLANRLGRNLQPFELDYLAGLGDVYESQLDDIVRDLHTGKLKAPVLKLAR